MSDNNNNYNPNVSHPSHYNAGKIEVIEAIEDWGLDFHQGNVVKYVARAGKKDPTKIIEDLEKGAWYLKRKIELLKAERDGRKPVRPNAMVMAKQPLREIWVNEFQHDNLSDRNYFFLENAEKLSKDDHFRRTDWIRSVRFREVENEK